MWLNIKLRESFCSPAARLVHGAHKSRPLGRAQRMQKYLLQQPKQWSCSERGCQLMFLLEWSCPLSLAAASKRKRKKEETQHKQKKPKLCDRQCLAGRYYVGCIVFQVSSPHLKELCLFYGSQTRHFFSWLSTLGAFFGASFTQPEQEPELLMIWALLIYTYHWLKTPVCNSYCTLFQCTGGKQSHCLPYVSNNKHKPGD